MTINRLLEESVQCPFCWEYFTILVDASEATQEYVEDCEICCRPIDFNIELDEQDRVSITIRQPDE